VYARASARIPVAEQCGVRDVELGKARGKSVGRFAAPATILKESLKRKRAWFAAALCSSTPG